MPESFRITPPAVAAILSALIGLSSPDTLSAGEAPLGGKAFYPSPENPVGYRGDGNGYFPGATPVAEWWEGTPVEKEIESGDKKKPTKYWDFADQKSKNLVWKTEMPSWANTQPLVIGDRVVTYAEPDQVVCCDAITGKILWTTAINPWLAAGAEPAKAEVARKLGGAVSALGSIVQMQWHFGTCGRYLSQEQLETILKCFVDQDATVMEKTLTAIDPQGEHDATIREFKDKIVAAIKTPVEGARACWGYANNFKMVGKICARAAALSGKQIPAEAPWGNMVGFCMSVPVSDGEFIYASMGQGQTACLDLNGKIIWQTWFNSKITTLSTHHVISPLLADGVLVDVHDPNTMRGLDTKTGKPLWEAPTSRSVKSTKGGYYVANHRIVRLGGIAYLVTSLGAIIRVKDGKIVGEYDYGPAYHGGTPLAGCGDIIAKAALGDGWGQPFRAFRLTAKSPDKVTAEQIWEAPGGVYYQSRVFTPTAAWLFTSKVRAVDVKSGAVLNNDPMIVGEFRIIAGTTLITMPGSDWSSRRPDGKAIMPFTTVNISDDKAPKILSSRNVLGGINLPRSNLTETFIPAVWAKTEFTNAKGGRPAHMVHTDTSLMPQGNRLFIRTVSHLYCIGDPKTAYDWDPSSRPARISSMLSGAK